MGVLCGCVCVGPMRLVRLLILSMKRFRGGVKSAVNDIFVCLFALYYYFQVVGICVCVCVFVCVSVSVRVNE